MDDTRALYRDASPAGRQALDRAWRAASESPPPWHPAALDREGDGPRPPRRSPDAPPRAIPLDDARDRAERAAIAALRRMAPLAGAVWGCRTHSARLRMMRGLLGRAAVWVYECQGEVHSGWVLRGSWWRWRVWLDAATGEVMEAEVKGRGR